jgi:hypothetical protein
MPAVFLAMPLLVKPDTLCRLCQTTKAIERSHIISRFLWKNSLLAHRKDNKGFDFICQDQSEWAEKDKKSGFFEPILCHGCEKIRNRLETYMAGVLYNHKNLVRDPTPGHRIIEGLCYKQFKLFTMFNLFMMGMSKHPFYAAVDLGDRHASKLRDMLLRDDPGEPWEYGTIWSRMLFAGQPLEGLAIPPDRIRWGSKYLAYRNVFAGIWWVTFCSSHHTVGYEDSSFIGRDGRLILFDAQAQDLPFVQKRITEYLRTHSPPTC